MIKILLNFSRRIKQVVAIVSDCLLIMLALAIAFFLRMQEPIVLGVEPVIFWVLSPIIAIPVFIKMGMYQFVTRYIGIKSIFIVLTAVTIYALLWSGIFYFGSGIEASYSFYFINWLLALFFIGGSRLLARMLFLEVAISKKVFQKNALIYGAGVAGRQLATALSYSNELKPVGFIDDDKSLINQTISGIEVVSPDSLEKTIHKLDVQEILLALPSATKKRRQTIISSLAILPVNVRTVPGVSEIASGRLKVEDIRDIDISDLLGRDEIEPNVTLLNKDIKDKVVMVTGAGGSIGSELCRQIIMLTPKQLILLDHSEFHLYEIDKELTESGHDCVSVLGSVTDLERVLRICTTFEVETIYHAAAYKHVPMIEKNPAMGVKNNILGTWLCAEAAIIAGVETFVLISTDKAVRPTNVMGATKRYSELVLQALARQAETDENSTRFIMVRFGNVLGSSGSVVPLFRGQINEGGPVTVTHEEITRYFMTVSEAAQLVIQAGAMGRGGNVYVLDMGEPVKILDLARRMIQLSGLEVRDHMNPDGDIDIQITGLRPGEKLYEELLISNDVSGTEHPRILSETEQELPWKKVHEDLRRFSQLVEANDVAKIRTMLLKAIDGYDPQCEIQDVIWTSHPISDDTLTQANIHQVEFKKDL